MESVVEAVGTILLFVLTPVIVVWVLIGLTQVIENRGKPPIDESEIPPVCHWAGNSEEAVLDRETFHYRAGGSHT